MSQRGNSAKGPDRLASLVATESSFVPNLSIRENRLRRGWADANQHLQMSEWAYKEYFAGAIIDENTGEALEYRDLIKRPELKQIWFRAFANELGRLAQGIRDIAGTDTIFFIPRSKIPKDRLRDVTYG